MLQKRNIGALLGFLVFSCITSGAVADDETVKERKIKGNNYKNGEIVKEIQMGPQRGSTIWTKQKDKKRAATMAVFLMALQAHCGQGNCAPGSPAP